MLVGKQFRFEASHQIDGHFGKCARLHGHSWVLHVNCEGEIDPVTGVVIDYYHISRAVDPLIRDLDHHHLGEGWVTSFEGFDPDKRRLLLSDVHWIPPGFKPTSENLLVLIADQLELTGLINGTTIPWAFLTINETCSSQATLSRVEYNNMRGHGLPQPVPVAVPYGKEITPHGEERHDEERSEEGKEDAQERLQETREDVERRRLEITDDDIPF